MMYVSKCENDGEFLLEAHLASCSACNARNYSHGHLRMQIRAFCGHKVNTCMLGYAQGRQENSNCVSMTKSYIRITIFIYFYNNAETKDQNFEH